MKTPAFLLTAVLAAAPLAAPSVSWAQASDPAGAVIERFDAALLETMKAGKSLGPEGRYRKLQAPMEAAFDLPKMTRIAVGPDWAKMSEAEHEALVKAFTRVSVATFAHNFDDYSGEKFVVGKVDTRLPDKLVHSQVVNKGAPAADLNFRMQQSASGQWKVVDVMFGAVSQILAQRSDYSATLKTGGAKALVAKLNDQAERLLK